MQGAVRNHSVDTVYSADSLEFSPHHPSIFAVGTYQLEKPVEEGGTAPAEPEPMAGYDDDGNMLATPAAKRRGRCLVYETDDAGFTEKYRVEGPAILDMKWNPDLTLNQEAVLAVADAEGRVVTHHWDAEAKRLVELQTLQVTDPTTLVLSLDWSNRITSSSTPSLITSLSNLSLSHLVASSTGELVVDRTWAAHDYEPWVASWDGWNPHVVYSGGDDCKLKGWDIRTAENEQPIWTNKRFDAGVTCIQTSPHRPNIIAVGSYNSTLTLLDPRYPSRSLIDPIDIGGGAWRVKWHPSAERSNDILVACMHDGFKVIRLTMQGEAETVSVSGSELLTRFDGHESLAYGADWSYASESVGGETLVGSASFYDHLVHLWSA